MDTFSCIPYTGLLEWKWYVKSTEYRGETNLTSYAYCKCSAQDHTVCLPQDIVGSGFSVSTGNGFEAQGGVVCELVTAGDAVPQHLVDVCRNKQAAIVTTRTRSGAPGSVIIAGATGPRAYMVNGTYEPIDEVCNEMPVYRNKDSTDYWYVLRLTSTRVSIYCRLNSCLCIT